MKIISREQLGIVYSIMFVPQHRTAKCEKKECELQRSAKSEKIDNGILSAILHFPPQHILQYV